MLPLHPPRDLRGVSRLSVDICVPESLGDKLSVTPSVKGAKKDNAAPAAALRAGWNTVAIDLAGPWLPAADRAAATEVEWTLSGSEKLAGWVVFDNLRAEGAKDGGPGLHESWEGKLLWGIFNDSVRQEAIEELVTDGKRALKVQFDLSRFPRPLLYAPLDPPWDLGGVDSLAIDVHVPAGLAGSLQLNLALVHKDTRYKAAPVILKAGWNKAAVPLEGWLPRQARAAVEQVEWTLSGSDRKLKGWVVVDNFRAGGARK
jgi:hypothetical protein